jgi:hypothetical protein
VWRLRKNISVGVTAITSDCAGEHSLGRWGRFILATKLLVQAMNGKAQTRISWHRLVTVVLALVVTAAPISASLCATGDCFASSPKTEAGCSSMTMPRNASAIVAGSRGDCCQVRQGLPATVRPSTESEKAKAEFLAVPLPTGLPNAVAARGTVARPIESSPPQDVQSLFCTLLI